MPVNDGNYYAIFLQKSFNFAVVYSFCEYMMILRVTICLVGNKSIASEAYQTL